MTYERTIQVVMLMLVILVGGAFVVDQIQRAIEAANTHTWFCPEKNISVPGTSLGSAMMYAAFNDINLTGCNLMEVV
jgi:hypothetical protein